jgi:hypothetical protein
MPPIASRLGALAAAAAPLVGFAHPGGPAAHGGPIEQVEITGHYDNAVGTSDAASEGVVGAGLLKSRPPLRPGEVLEFVPGVIVTQHSGDGKANQFFLRGFNLDHGTDFATRVEGMPVNLPTHGHGHGYSDLNFLIPELIHRIAYRKGPTFAADGDFSSAGSADIAYRKRLDRPFVQLTLAADGYRRGVLGGSTTAADGSTWLGAFEAQRNDGPWTRPEDLRRLNAVLSHTRGTNAEGWNLTAMAYDARWYSTDQIPQRLIDAGSFQGRPFGRFDTIDPTSGGESSRASLSGEWHRRTLDGTRTSVSAYAIRYRLALWSNFTYFQERPDEGDQFSQTDSRTVWGGDLGHAFPIEIAGVPVRAEAGLRLRHDRIRVGLFDTVAREVVRTTREDAVRQTMAGAYVQGQVEPLPAWRATFGLRMDHLRTQVDALTLAANGGRARATQWSPRFALVGGPWAKTELFLNAGRGLHSNDARGTTAAIDPKSGDPVDRVPPLVASRGWELGLRTEAVKGLQSSLALWHLDFDSELVYVGDAGATEAGPASRRRGVEWSNRYTPLPWLLFDADLAWTKARFAGGDRIPNSVDRVASLAAAVRDVGGWSASVQLRHLGPGALIEDDSVRSFTSTTINARLSRRLDPWLPKGSEVTLDVFNLTDRAVNDIQYFYESQLPGEAAPVADRHVHPGEPRTLRLTLAIAF